MKNNKREKIELVVSIALLLLIFFSFSYAYYSTGGSFFATGRSNGVYGGGTGSAYSQ
jgi:hypothetical protein